MIEFDDSEEAMLRQVEENGVFDLVGPVDGTRH
jgi:hypothetical protein